MNKHRLATFALLLLAVALALPGLSTSAQAQTPPGLCKIPEPLKPEGCACPRYYFPVCGCDGVTYGNDCMARCEVLIYTPGECGS